MPAAERLAVVAAVLSTAALLAGCANRYFQDTGAPPPVARQELARWPYREYWSGITFNGAKIGFSHLRLAAAPDAPGHFEIESEAVFTLRMSGLEKRFQLRSRDTVRADLTLVRFAADSNIDGNRLALAGVHDGHTLRVTITARDQVSAQTLAVDTPLYPVSALYLYPVLHGLALERRYRYTVYDTELQQLARVEQDIEAYERSALLDGPAFRLQTRLPGQQTTVWINARGEPVLESALNGALIAARESEETARRYLVAASLNKQDTLLDFSLVRLDRPIAQPQERAALTLAVGGLGALALPPPEPRQRCVADGAEVVCELRRVEPTGGAGVPPPAAARYLESTLAAPSTHPRIVALAREITHDAPTPRAQAGRIVEWIQRHVTKAPVDVFSALDVLEGGRAECQGHSYLYAALARARGIPTRVVNGLTYSAEHAGFLYHTWTESWLGSDWVAVDPTFAQIGVDATHLKLLEGESPADLLPLAYLLGRLRLRVIE